MPEADAPKRSHPALWALAALALAGVAVLRFVRERNGDETVSYALGCIAATTVIALRERVALDLTSRVVGG